MLAVTVDPTKEFKGISPSNLLDYCTPIIAMLDREGESLREGIENNYHFFSGWQEGGFEVDEDGTYRFPEDRPLKPMVLVEKFGEVAYIYEYAIVVIVDKDGNKMYTRVD
jgi:hypothetical protein